MELVEDLREATSLGDRNGFEFEEEVPKRYPVVVLDKVLAEYLNHVDKLWARTRGKSLMVSAGTLGSDAIWIKTYIDRTNLPVLVKLCSFEKVELDANHAREVILDVLDSSKTRVVDKMTEKYDTCVCDERVSAMYAVARSRPFKEPLTFETLADDQATSLMCARYLKYRKTRPLYIFYSSKNVWLRIEYDHEEEEFSASKCALPVVEKHSRFVTCGMKRFETNEEEKCVKKAISDVVSTLV